MKNYAAYNLWANTTLINWLRSKPGALMDQEALSSFPSITATLEHIWKVQQYWFSVISGRQYTPPEFRGAAADIFELLIDQSAEMVEYISDMTATDLEGRYKVVNPWFECDLPRFEYLIQCMNHSTYHRGQVVTIGRSLGFTDAPMTDYNYYNVFGQPS